MFEGVKVSRQLLLFGWDFRGIQEQGPMLSALKGGANTSRKKKKRRAEILRSCVSI